MRGNRVAERGWGRPTASTGVLVLVFSLLGVGAAMAATPFQADIVIDQTDTGDEDSLLHLATVAVPLEFRGQECTARSVGQNQSSIHPGNDLLVDSGGTQVVIPDVERAPNAVVNGIGTLILGPEIDVSVRFGPDEFFSAGLIVEIRCTGDSDSGRIVVVKEVTEGSDTSQVFDFSTSYDADGFSLADGQQNDSGELDPGTYSVAETVPDGWSLQSAICDDQSPISAIDVSAGETVTCTFTNDETPPGETGQIIVVKDVLLGDSEVQFVFETTGFTLADNTLSHGQSSSSGPLSPGTYSVEEDLTGLPEGWALEGASCDNAVGDPGNIELAAGEVVTCTFVNSFAEVGASIVLTVTSVCDVVANEGVGRITVTMSVAGGADVVVRDSSGDVVGTLGADGTISVPEGEIYTWVATPNPGFEFPAGFDNTGSVTIETCSNPEILPFTGLVGDELAALGILLLALGALTLLGSRPVKGGSS